MPARLTEGEVREKLAARGFMLVSRYEHANARATIACAYGHQWQAYPSNAWRAGRCTECDRRAAKLELKQRLDGRGIYLVGGFTGTKKKCLFACLACAYSFSARPCDIVRGGGCPRCSGLVRLTEEEKRLSEAQRAIAERIRMFMKEPSNRGAVTLLGGSCTQLSRLVSKEAVAFRAEVRARSLTVDHIIPVTFIGYLDEQSVIDLEDVRNLRAVTWSENSRRRHLLTKDEVIGLNKYCRDLLYKYKDRWIERFPMVWTWLENT